MEFREKIGPPRLPSRVEAVERKLRFWRWVAAALAAVLVVISAGTVAHFQYSHWGDTKAIALAKQYDGKELRPGNPCNNHLAEAIAGRDVEVAGFRGKLFVKQSQVCEHIYTAVIWPEAGNTLPYEVGLLVGRPGQPEKVEAVQKSIEPAERGWTVGIRVPEGTINAVLTVNGQTIRLLVESRPVV